MPPNSFSWPKFITAERKKPYLSNLLHEIGQQRAQQTVYPADDQIFNALSLTPFNEVKVVILGQDPYHNEGQAHGLSFSVPPGIKTPPSLVNIFKELNQDIGMPRPKHGCLTAWAKQGVLLLNSVLTVVAHQPQSHAKLGWQQFTDTIIASLNDHPKAIVFMLWGAYAQKKAKLISNPHHLILTAPHPSPLSAHRGFLGCQHFSKCNTWLQQHNREPINWDCL